MSRTLAEQIDPDAYAEWSVLGRPAAQALERLVRGPLGGPNDLALAEVALRAICLHGHAAILDPRASSLASEEIGLFHPFPQPSLSYRSDDPSIPPSLLSHVDDPMGGMRDFIRSRVAPIEGVDPPVPPLAAPGEAVFVGTAGTGPPVRRAVPGLRQALDGMAMEHQMSTNLLVGYLGGSSLLAMADAYDTVSKTLDTFYGAIPPRPAGEAPPPSTLVPRLLPVVLSRTKRRADLVNTIGNLKADLAPGVRRLHELRVALGQGRSAAEQERAGRELQRELLRLRISDGDPDALTVAPLRGASVAGITGIATALASVLAGAEPYAALISGLIAMGSAAGMTKAMDGSKDRPLTASFAFSVRRHLRTGPLPFNVDLERLLEPAELARLDTALGRSR